MPEDEVKNEKVNLPPPPPSVPPPPPNVPEPPPAEEAAALEPPSDDVPVEESPADVPEPKKPAEDTPKGEAVAEKDSNQKDPLEALDKKQLRNYVKGHKLQIPKYKKMNPDELREAIRNYVPPTPEEIKKDKTKDQTEVQTKDKPGIDKLKRIIKKELSEYMAARVIDTFNIAIKVQPDGDPVKIMINSVRISSNVTVANNIASKLK